MKNYEKYIRVNSNRVTVAFPESCENRSVGFGKSPELSFFGKSSSEVAWVVEKLVPCGNFHIGGYWRGKLFSTLPAGVEFTAEQAAAIFFREHPNALTALRIVLGELAPIKVRVEVEKEKIVEIEKEVIKIVQVEDPERVNHFAARARRAEKKLRQLRKIL